MHDYFRLLCSRHKYYSLSQWNGQHIILSRYLTARRLRGRAFWRNQGKTCIPILLYDTMVADDVDGQREVIRALITELMLRRRKMIGKIEIVVWHRGEHMTPQHRITVRGCDDLQFCTAELKFAVCWGGRGGG